MNEEHVPHRARLRWAPARRPHPNLGRGEDYHGHAGIARWTPENGHRRVVLMDWLDVVVWQVDVSNTAPGRLFDYAWRDAQDYADGCYGEVTAR